MTQKEYKKIIQEYIRNEESNVEEIADNIDTAAERLTDIIGAIYPTETDEERDELVKAVYEVLRGANK